MTVPVPPGHPDPEAFAEGVELTDEELSQVVGGLNRGWWPDPGDPAGPQSGY